MTIDSDLIAQAEAESRLYEKYGKPLEADHAGEFVAISMDGEILLGKRDGETTLRAIDKFGRGNFTIARVGVGAIHEWSPIPPRATPCAPSKNGMNAAMSAADSEWIARTAAERRRLYEKYGKPLESEHAGEFVAISMDGDVLLGKRDGETILRAIDKFGHGNFAMARVGYDPVHEWTIA